MYSKMFRSLVGSGEVEEEAHEAILGAPAWIRGEQDELGFPRNFERESERIYIDRAANRLDCTRAKEAAIHEVTSARTGSATAMLALLRRIADANTGTSQTRPSGATPADGETVRVEELRRDLLIAVLLIATPGNSDGEVTLESTEGSRRDYRQSPQKNRRKIAAELMLMIVPCRPRPAPAALRPPPSRSRSTHRGRDHRHGPRSPSLDGAWLAGRGADGRGLSGGCGPHGAGAPTRGPEAAATRPQAHGAAPARAGRATNLRVSPHRSASAGRTRQDADPARRGSGPRVPPVASGPAVPACIAQSVPRLAPAAARVCARRSVLLSPHLAVSTDAPRGPGDRGDGHFARVSSRPDRQARRPRATTRQGLGLALNLVPPRPAARLAPPPAPRASGETQDRTSHKARGRDMAHRHHRHPPAPQDPRLSPCRDRQFLATHLGLAGRRHVRAGQPR